jgi:hypothetical protein
MEFGNMSADILLGRIAEKIQVCPVRMQDDAVFAYQMKRDSAILEKVLVVEVVTGLA